MRSLFKVLPVCSLFLACFSLHAQNYPVYNSYYINPYLYNPAEAASEFTYIFVNHRQQWMGVEGAPRLTTANFNTLLNESRAGVGVKLSSYSRGILTSSDISLTYAYGLLLNQKNTLFFGLSGGVISNTIDTEGIIDDPAVENYVANNIQPTANFGLLFRSASGLNFGVTLPQLFAPKFNSGASFEATDFSPVDNIIGTLYYRKKVEGKIVAKRKKGVRTKVKTKEAYAPLEFYLMYKYAKAGNSQFEAMTKLNLSENFWLGAGYRLSYGFTGSLGFSYGKFLMAYSYEPGGQPTPGFSQATHELQLGVRLGEVRKFKRTAPMLRSTIRTTNESHVARFQQTVEDPDKIQSTDETKKKYYVVIRSFGDFTSADEYKRKLIDQKYNANVFYYDKDRKYHVHVLETSKHSEAAEEAKNLKNYTKLKDARVLTVTTTGK